MCSCFSMCSRSWTAPLQEILRSKSSLTHPPTFDDTMFQLLMKLLSSFLVNTCMRLTLETSFYTRVKAISGSSTITTTHTHHYIMFSCSLTAPLAGLMISHSMQTLTQLLTMTLQIPLQMRSISLRSNITLIACTHDKMSFRSYS